VVHIQPVADEFRGFDEARTIMWCHEARARTYARLSQTTFLADENVVAVHIENTSRVDRVFLSAFDRKGRLLAGDTLFIDEPTEHLDVTPEFDHDFTNLSVPAGSELEEIINSETGWTANMPVLRGYDPLADRRATQRAVFLAHLGDMLNTGQAQGFLFGKSSGLASEDGESDAA
jgi:hypothetical protein